MSVKTIIVSIAVLVCASIASAGVYDFNSAAGDWGVSANWVDPNGVNGIPGAFDTAYVRNGGVMSIPADQSALILSLGASKLIPDPNWVNPDPNDPNNVRPNIETGLAGTVQYTAGQLTAPTLQVGGLFRGDMTQTGGSMSFGVAGTDVFTIGGGAAGSSYTLDGGTIAAPAGINGGSGILIDKNGTFNLKSGLINVTQPGYRQITVGNSGGYSALLNITGGTLNGGGGIRLGTSAGVDARMVVDGPSAVVNLGADDLGINRGGDAASGNGLVQMKNGLISTSGKVLVGDMGHGRFEMSGGSAWVGNQIRVGNDTMASGEFYQTGGSVTTASVVINNSGGGASSVIVNGGVFSQASAGTDTTSVGESGVGTFAVQSGVANVNVLELGKYASSNSTLQLTGGTLNIAQKVQRSSSSSTSNVILTGGILGCLATNMVWDMNGANLALNGCSLINGAESTRSQLYIGTSGGPASNFTMTGGHLDVDIFSAVAGTGADKIYEAGGSVSFANVVVDIDPKISLSGLTKGTSYFIIGQGKSTSFPASVTNVTTSDPSLWSVTASAQNIRLNYIPEPATMSLLVLGGLAILRRRR